MEAKFFSEIEKKMDVKTLKDFIDLLIFIVVLMK